MTTYWGKRCELCKLKPASGEFDVSFRGSRGPYTKAKLLCAACCFNAATRWNGRCIDPDPECPVFIPKMVGIKLHRSLGFAPNKCKLCEAEIGAEYRVCVSCWGKGA